MCKCIDSIEPGNSCLLLPMTVISTQDDHGLGLRAATPTGNERSLHNKGIAFTVVPT